LLARKPGNTAAERALKAIRVEYEQYPALLTSEQAMAAGAGAIHEECPDNILKHTVNETPMSPCGFQSAEEVLASPAYHQMSGHYETQQVQHCHIENPISYAYMEGGRITVVTSTQIPHIVRRVIGQALGVGWGKIRVIKPYIGGGFGNKQEVLYEPLNAFLTTMVGGRKVKLELNREETFQSTRSRHAISFDVRAAVDNDGRLMARECIAVSNQGGYASHGHAIVSNAVTGFRQTYLDALGLEKRLKHLPNQLSGGQQQRVSIGRALINNPAIMLADEPTGNLDSKNSSEIIELLKMFNKTYKQTLLVITHDERIALQADRIIAIEDGRIAKDEVIRP
jgi:CO/xanthine dehydrogenase Mo-binding subunit